MWTLILLTARLATGPCYTADSVADQRTLFRFLDTVDPHSLAADPRFVNPANGDFRFKPDSPALKMGIGPFDISKVGSA